MEIDQPAVAFPSRQHTADSLVIQWCSQLEPARQAVACAHIVAGKNVPSPQAAEQNVLRGPTAHTAQLLQSLNSLFVTHLDQRFQVELPLADGPRRLDHRPRFLVAESQRS